MRANLEAFERRRLRPRMLAGNAERDLSVEVLGLRSPVPVPARAGRRALDRPRGGRAGRRARRRARRACRWCSRARRRRRSRTWPPELGDAPRWFQLYWWADRELAGSLVDRAAAAGYGALVVTLDTLMLGWRDRDLRNGYLPFLAGRGPRPVLQRPALPRAARRTAGGRRRDRLAPRARRLPEPRPDVGGSRLAARPHRPADPRQGRADRRGRAAALDAGVDGLVVSNHGGRQVDGAVAALDALVEVRDAVGADATVLMDSGIRRGSDILKAIALGADAVLLGRPYAYGLAVGGQAGVEAVIRQLAAELDLTLALAGVPLARDARPRLGHMRLYREERGEGQPLLLLTGLGYAIWSWQRQIPAWSRQFRVIAVDNRGTGRSPKPPGPYSIEAAGRRRGRGARGPPRTRGRLLDGRLHRADARRSATRGGRAGSCSSAPAPAARTSCGRRPRRSPLGRRTPTARPPSSPAPRCRSRSRLAGRTSTRRSSSSSCRPARVSRRRRTAGARSTTPARRSSSGLRRSRRSRRRPSSSTATPTASSPTRTASSSPAASPAPASSPSPAPGTCSSSRSPTVSTTRVLEFLTG